MDKFFQNLNTEIQEYLKILSPDFPDWLLDYINTPEMLRLNGIGTVSYTHLTLPTNSRV